MWSDWLADTLNRSMLDSMPRATLVQRVLLSESDRTEQALGTTDWEVVTGLLIHEGFGAEGPDA